jgi:1,3-beta-glucanosyltransferase GAS1
MTGLVEVNLRPGFSALQAQLASIHPSSTKISEYTPTNRPPSPCHDVTWVSKSTQGNETVQVVSANEYPKPDKRLCSCMMNSVGCVVKQDNIPNEAVAISGINRICAENKTWCGGINGNASTGTYGSYVLCKYF